MRKQGSIPRESETMTVIKMRPPRDGAPVALKPGRSRGCRHKQVDVDPGERTVECSRCGAVIDPFDAILMIADEWEGLDAWARRRERERDEAFAKTKELKAEEKRLKARIRTAKRRIESD